MMNSTLEILHNLKENQANSITLLNRRFSGYQLKVSREASGRLRGWVIAHETREVRLKGLPVYLTLQRATQLLEQSYLKLHKETIEILPKGLGGGINYSRPSSDIESEETEMDEEGILPVSKPSESDINSLVEAIASEQKKEYIRKAVKILCENDAEKKELDLGNKLSFSQYPKINNAGAQALAAALQVNQTIQSLNLSNNHIGNTGAQALGTALKVNQSLQSLNLKNNCITAGSRALATGLKVNQAIQSLDLTYNQIGDVGAQALGVMLQVNQSLQALNLGYNSIGGPGAQALNAALKVNQTIQSVDLFGNEIGDAGAQALGDALQVNQSLQWLTIYHNSIGAAGARALGTALQVNQSLQVLNLEHNNIGDAGARALGNALQVNQTIQTLNLHYNQIGDDGARALGAGLQVNHTLQSLNLHYNRIGIDGAQALGTALQVNQSLQKLNLSSNRIGDIGIQALGASLQVNQSLRSLDLGYNLIDAAGAQALGTALQVNQSLQKLNLSSNGIGDIGAQALGAALQVNQSLQELYIEKNRIGTAGAQALGAALQVNHTLSSLNFGSNQIGNAGTQAIAAALQVNHTLQWLGINEDLIGDEGIITKKRIDTLLQGNKQITILFQQQIIQVQDFLQSHENNDGILLEHLPQLKELLQKWHTDSKNIIPSLEEILRQSGRSNLNDRYREKLKGIITNLTNRLHDLWLESFERKVAVLSNQYVIGKESAEKRNADLGYALYETWLTFLGSDCPNWAEDHIQSLIPFGVLLDIAESGEKKDVTDLTDAHLLFERVLSFKNESKDSLCSLTIQS